MGALALTHNPKYRAPFEPLPGDVTFVPYGDAEALAAAVDDTVAAVARGSTDHAVREIWAPTEALIAMLPKSQQLAIAEPLVERVVFDGWSRKKAGEIPALVVGALAGTGAAVRKSMQETARRWVHPMLQFKPDPRAAEQEEADNAHNDLVAAAEGEAIHG